jgi:predicted helicase
VREGAIALPETHSFVADREGKICGNKRRSLLVMATGTGKTYTAFQIIYRLWKAKKKKLRPKRLIKKS